MMPLARARACARSCGPGALIHLWASNLLQAKWNSLRALASYPSNPVALNDPGAIFGKEDTRSRQNLHSWSDRSLIEDLSPLFFDPNRTAR